MRISVRTGGASVALAVLAAGLSAPAQQRLGAPVNFSLPTTSGHPRSVAQYRGRVVILFYESREVVAQNQPLKDALGRQGERDPSLAQRFALIPVANVGAYNFWPAQHFAREAITAIARHQGVEMWFDWDRTLVHALGLRDGASNVVVLDRQGRVRYHRWGRIAPGDVERFLSTLSAVANEG